MKDNNESEIVENLIEPEFSCDIQYNNEIEAYIELDKCIAKALNKKPKPITTIGLCKSGCIHYDNGEGYDYCRFHARKIIGGWKCCYFDNDR
jgi:hypothetical protein